MLQSESLIYTYENAFFCLWTSLVNSVQLLPDS